MRHIVLSAIRLLLNIHISLLLNITPNPSLTIHSSQHPVIKRYDMLSYPRLDCSIAHMFTLCSPWNMCSHWNKKTFAFEIICKIIIYFDLMFTFILSYLYKYVRCYTYFYAWMHFFFLCYPRISYKKYKRTIHCHLCWLNSNEISKSIFALTVKVKDKFVWKPNSRNHNQYLEPATRGRRQ